MRFADLILDQDTAFPFRVIPAPVNRRELGNVGLPVRPMAYQELVSDSAYCVHDHPAGGDAGIADVRGGHGVFGHILPLREIAGDGFPERAADSQIFRDVLGRGGSLHEFGVGADDVRVGEELL